MRLILLAVLAVVLLGCTGQEPAQKPSPAVVVTLAPTIVATATPTIIVTVSPVATATPIPSIASIETPLPTPTTLASPQPTANASKMLPKDFKDLLRPVIITYFGRTGNVYQPDENTWALSDYTPKHNYEMFVRKAKFAWTGNDLVTNFTSYNNKIKPGVINARQQAGAYIYSFKFMCFNDSIEVEGTITDFMSAASPDLGKNFTSLVVDLCA